MAYKKCRYLIVEPSESGRVLVRKDWAYRCDAEVDLPDLPASITRHYSFSWPPSRSFVTKDDCAKCPMYAPQATTPEGET